MTYCGDGIIAGEEICDDGNEDNEDGCSSTCSIENGWYCEGEVKSVCKDFICGNGILEGEEVCDDGEAPTEANDLVNCLNDCSGPVEGYRCNEESPS